MNFCDLVVKFFKRVFSLTLTIPSLFLFSCTTQTIAQESAVTQQNAQKINYLAIGDSTTLSFSAANFTFSLGQQDKQTKRVSGTSWPAFFANYIQEISPSSLESFKNLGLIGVSLQNWIDVLGSPSSFEERISPRHLQDFPKHIQTLNGSLTIERNFERNIVEQGFYQEALNSILDANLITVSLGMQDMLLPFFKTLFALKKQVSTFLRTKSSKSKFSFEWPEMVKTLVETSEQVTENLKIFIRTLKTINKNAQIVLVGYSYNSLFVFSSIFDEIIKRFTAKWTGQIVEVIFLLLNQALSNAARDTGSSFINVFQKELWSKNINPQNPNYAPIYYLDYLLNILPSTKGNKWIAQQVFLKLALPFDLEFQQQGEQILETTLNQYLEWLGLDKLPTSISFEYVKQDLGSFKPLLSFSYAQQKRIPRLLIREFLEKNRLEREKVDTPPPLPFLVPSQLTNILTPDLSELVLNTLISYYTMFDGKQLEFHEVILSVLDRVDFLLNYVLNL